jgi:hypothetical protein
LKKSVSTKGQWNQPARLVTGLGLGLGSDLGLGLGLGLVLGVSLRLGLDVKDQAKFFTNNGPNLDRFSLLVIASCHLFLISPT